MFAWLKSLRNAVDFPLRRSIRWTRGVPPNKSEEIKGAFDHLSEHRSAAMEARAHELVERYGLYDFKTNCTLKNYTINLYYLEMLERTFTDAEYSFQAQKNLKVADVGPGTWIYAPALHSFLRRWASSEVRNLELTGYEIDAYRVFNDLRSRFDHMQGHIQNLPNTSIVTKEFKERTQHFDLVTLFYPFILVPDHLDWGLPRSVFKPRALLNAAWNSVRPGGALFIANQGAEEFVEQKKLLEELGASGGLSMPFASDLHPYEIPRFSHLRIKSACVNEHAQF